MNKETLDLLQQLAAKLGTTADHLWAVMVRQAFISACIDFLYYVGAFGLVWFASRKIPKWLETIKETDSEGKELAYGIAVGILSLATVIYLGVCVAQIESTITALTNPEYWALKQILEAVGGKQN